VIRLNLPPDTAELGSFLNILVSRGSVSELDLAGHIHGRVL